MIETDKQYFEEKVERFQKELTDLFTKHNVRGNVLVTIACAKFRIHKQRSNYRDIEKKKR